MTKIEIKAKASELKDVELILKKVREIEKEHICQCTLIQIDLGINKRCEKKI
ncbi:hypothetical protein HYG86_09330 [Alkalicella caledoniensis]|uniref:Uncharacterized protein n=1 Tax=Alkalicella caledoniensis TaxID=2731377 RepID=A0A7G9W8F1_ALKCA|nr:hypothetical protein [Alkalicella caledoniensis]QNO14963.1 hypothetical protein HYG86_09330 [Alkalicella caledoniensis]